MCVAGYYRDEEGQSACKPAPGGFFCPDASAFPIPASCRAGTYVVGNCQPGRLHAVPDWLLVRGRLVSAVNLPRR